MNLNLRRLSILTPQEIDDLYDLPHFTDQDRYLYFDLSPVERKVVGGVHTTSAAVQLILQLGYFKAKHQFFNYERETVLDDLRFIVKQHFPQRDLASITQPSAPTRLEQQRVILKLFDYRFCDKIAKQELEHKAKRIAMLSTHPVYIFREVLQYLTHQRILTPSYSFLQEMVGRVVGSERKRISHLLGQSLTLAVEEQLNALLHADERICRINALKHEPKNFSYKELRQEVERRKFFQPLSEFAQAFLATTGISNESVKYYASLVTFYTLYKLQRMPTATTRLYLLCFAYHRFRQINDNLIEAFIHLVNQYEKQAKLAADEALQKSLTDATGNLRAAGQVLSLFVDASIPDEATFAIVKKKAFTLLDPERFPPVSNFMRNIAFDKTGSEWSTYATLSPTFKRNLRHLFSDLEFAGRVEDAPLLEAISFLQALFRQDKSLDIPMK